MREALSMPTGDTWIITRPKLRSPPATRGGQLMNTTKLDERALWESPTRKEKAKHVRKKIEGIEVWKNIEGETWDENIQAGVVKSKK